MLEFMKCTNCNKELSSKYELFMHLKRKVIMYKFGHVKLEKVQYDSQIQESLVPIFETLNINRECCRMTLGTAKILDIDEMIGV